MRAAPGCVEPGREWVSTPPIYTAKDWGIICFKRAASAESGPAEILAEISSKIGADHGIAKATLP